MGDPGARPRLDRHTCGALIQVTKRRDSFSAHYCTPIKIPPFIHLHINLLSVHKWKTCSHRSYLVVLDSQTALEINFSGEVTSGNAGGIWNEKTSPKNYTTDMTDG